MVSLELRVCGLDGELCSLHSERRLPMRMVREAVASKLDMDADCFDLVIGGVALNDTCLVADCLPARQPSATDAATVVEVTLIRRLNRDSAALLEELRSHNDERTRVQAVDQLAETVEKPVPDEVSEALAEALGDEDISVRLAVQAAIQHLGCCSNAAVAVLKKLIRAERIPGQPCENHDIEICELVSAFAVLAHSGCHKPGWLSRGIAAIWRLPAEAVLDPELGLLGPDTRCGSVSHADMEPQSDLEVLAPVLPGLQQLLLRYLKLTDDPQTRAGAVRLLGRLPIAAVAEVLPPTLTERLPLTLRLLEVLREDPDEEVRIAAVRALCCHGGLKVMPELLQALEGDDAERVRREVAQALASLGAFVGGDCHAVQRAVVVARDLQACDEARGEDSIHDHIVFSVVYDYLRQVVHVGRQASPLDSEVFQFLTHEDGELRGAVVDAGLEADPRATLAALQSVLSSGQRLHRARAAQACLQANLFGHWWCQQHDINNFDALDSNGNRSQTMLHTLAGDFAAVLTREVDVHHWESGSIAWAARGLAMLGDAASPALPVLERQVSLGCDGHATGYPAAKLSSEEKAEEGEKEEDEEDKVWFARELARASALSLGKLGKSAAFALPTLLQAEKASESAELQGAVSTAVTMIRADQGHVDIPALTAAFERGHDLGTALARLVPTAVLRRVLCSSNDDDTASTSFRLQAALLLVEHGEHIDEALDEFCRVVVAGGGRPWNSDLLVLDDVLVRRLGKCGLSTAGAILSLLARLLKDKFPRRCFGEEVTPAATIPWALAALGPEVGGEATALLREAMDCETHPALQSAAAGAILLFEAQAQDGGGECSKDMRETRDEAMHRLAAQLSDRSPSIRYEAALALQHAAMQLEMGGRRMKGEDAAGQILVKALCKATTDANSDVRTCAASTLSKLSPAASARTAPMKADEAEHLTGGD